MIKKITSQWAFLVLALLCITSFSLMLWASRTDSAIDDELAHIPAGYGYVHNLDYRLNPEHPPLIKALATLPVLLLQPNFPTQSTAWTTEVNGQWDMGTQFLYESGNNANVIIQTARLVPILITILLIILIYFFARRLMGKLWALLPTFLFALDPTVLAQGHYVTTDIGAAFGILFATFFFLKYVEKPCTKYLWFAGVSFGIAQLTKFSAPLLVPFFMFLMLVLWLRDSRSLKRFGQYAWRLILIFAIGYILIVYPVYFLFTSHYPITKQISDTQALLTSFATGPTPAGQMCSGTRCIADLDIWMSKSVILRPYAQYLLGILMVLQRADGGNTIYFLGQIRGSGGWIYFPVLFLLKEPIPTLIIVLGALFLSVLWLIRRKWDIRKYFYERFDHFAMAFFVIAYWGYSMHSQLNIGIRHIMPTIPFIFILASGVWKKWILQFNWQSITAGANLSLASIKNVIKNILRSFSLSIIKYLVLILLLFWLLLETLFAAPYFLSYFNEFGGGVMGGYHYVTDSNYDWGQDMLRLQSWVNANPQVDKIAVDYFGGGNPHYYLGDKEVDWSSSKGNPSAQGIQWLAVSVNTLESAIQPLAPGQSRNASDTYSWLTALRPPQPGMGNVPTPDYRIGTSIFVYHL
jgi:4-amino-4-deoxy-L-arabinose transferase-like glycosyltransferase